MNKKRIRELKESLYENNISFPNSKITLTTRKINNKILKKKHIIKLKGEGFSQKKHQFILFNIKILEKKTITEKEYEEEGEKNGK